jgi:hypothetical protein
MSDFADGLRRERHHRRNSRCAYAPGQLQKGHTSQNHPHLLHAAAQQFLQFLSVFRCDLNTQRRTRHTSSMQPKRFSMELFY